MVESPFLVPGGADSPLEVVPDPRPQIPRCTGIPPAILNALQEIGVNAEAHEVGTALAVHVLQHPDAP